MVGRLCIPLLALVLLAAEARAEVIVILRREAHPSGNYVRVCDIARVEGPADLVREVGMTVVGPSPSRGEVREVSRWEVENRLYEMGIAAAVTFSGNDTVRVLGSGASAPPSAPASGSFQELEPVPEPGTGRRDMAVTRVEQPLPVVAAKEPPGPETSVGMDLKARRSTPAIKGLSGEANERVGLAISNYLASRYRENGQRSDIEVESKVLSVSSDIPSSAHDIRVEEGLEGRVPGKAMLRVTVRDTADSPPREVRVEADTAVYAQALVAARKLSRGDTLEPHDVAVKRVRMKAGQAYLPPSPKAEAGRDLLTALSAGDPITGDNTAPGQLVKRGQKVLVENAGRGWVIKSTGKALGAGMLGDHITVEDSDTKNKFTARIVDRDKVAVIVDKRLK